MQDVVDVFKIAEKLECEYRLTRMSDGMRQSVAAHSWNMAFMAMVLSPYLKTPVNMERVYQLCLVHDLAEAIVHDVPLHEQTEEVRLKKHNDEHMALNQIISMLNNNDLAECFEEYDLRQSVEARLVKALDVLDTAVQHMCAQELSYVGKYKDNFYWKMFFSDDFASLFGFEPVLRSVFDLIRQRVAQRLKVELNIDINLFVEKEK